MIRLLASQLPSVMNILAEGKQKTFFIKDQIPFVETQVTVNVPTPESVLNLLPLISTPDQFAQIQNNFIRLKEQCKKTEATLIKLRDQIDDVLNKTNRIESIFGTLNGFIDLISDFIPLFKLIISVGQVTLAAQVFPVASGTITIRTGDAIKLAKSKLREIDSITQVLDSITDPILSQTNDIQDTLLPLRAKLQEIITIIKARCFYLDSVLIDKLKELELSMAQSPPSGSGNPQDTEQIVNVLSSQVNPENILDNLENSNKERFIEYLVENGFTGYQIIKK